MLDWKNNHSSRLKFESIIDDYLSVVSFVSWEDVSEIASVLSGIIRFRQQPNGHFLRPIFYEILTGKYGV